MLPDFVRILLGDGDGAVVKAIILVLGFGCIVLGAFVASVAYQDGVYPITVAGAVPIRRGLGSSPALGPLLG